MHVQRALIFRGVRERPTSISTASICAACRNMPPRWKRCVRLGGRRSGRGAGPGVRGPRRSRRTPSSGALAMTKEIEDGHGERNQAASLDGRGHQEAGPRKAARAWSTRSAIRTNGAITAPSRSSAATMSATWTRATVFESRRQLEKIGKPVDRGEWGMTPPTVNAYYDPQMNDINFPGGRAAAAAVRSEDGRRAQLWRHRRHHRPRTHARL